jgi:hypothetical protein
VADRKTKYIGGYVFMIHEFKRLIPVNTPLGEGWIILLFSSGELANSQYMVILDNGQIRYFGTTQLTVVDNATIGLTNGE